MKFQTVLISIFLHGFFVYQAKAQEPEEIKAFKNIDYEVKLELGMTQVYDYDASLAAFNGQLSPALMAGISTKINQQFSLQAGLAFQTYRMYSKDYSITFGSDIDPNTGLDQYKSWVVFNVQSYAVGLPIGLSYQFLKKPSYPFISARVKPLFLLGLGSSTSTFYESGLNTKETEFPDFFNHTFMLNPSAALGYSWAAADDLNLLFEAFFEYCPTRIGETAWPRQSFNFYSLGASVGVRF
jgi:hypothetical protein